MKKDKERLSEQKKAELQLIAEMTLDATLAAEEKISSCGKAKSAPLVPVCLS